VGPGAAREGSALLQGLLLCEHCSSNLVVNYVGTNGRYASYACVARSGEGAGLKCQSMSARFVDEPVVKLVLASLTPQALGDATRVLEIIEQQDSSIERQWTLRLERVRYEAKRAERQYDACEPENRTVARNLETRWNQKLLEVEQLEREYEEQRRRQRLELSDVERQRILALAQDLPRLWREKTTTDRDRKLLLRHLIKEVSVRSIEVPRPIIRAKVLWHTGAVTELESDRQPVGTRRKPVTSRIIGTYAPTVTNQPMSVGSATEPKARRR